MAIKSKPNRKREIDLTGPDGNAYFLLGTAMQITDQLKDVDPERYNWDVINEKMTSSDYENLIKVFDEYFGDFVDLVR